MFHAWVSLQEGPEPEEVFPLPPSKDGSTHRSQFDYLCLCLFFGWVIGKGAEVVLREFHYLLAGRSLTKRPVRK